MSSHSSVSTSSATTTATTGSSSSSSGSGSGTTRSTVPSATSPTPVTPKKKQAHNVFKRLVDCLKDISDYEPEYADFERVSRQRDDAISELEAIKLKLESKDKHINVLENARKLELGDVFAKTGQLQQDMQKLTDKWNEEKKQLGKAHSAEMQKVKGELQKHLSEIASLSNEHDRAKREVQLTKAQLEVANQELAQWKSPLSILRPLGVEDLAAKIEAFFRELVESVNDCFSDDLPDEFLSMHEAWEKGVLGLKNAFGFAPINSQSAKLMRVAVAMNVISNELTKTVFQPCYLVDSKESAFVQEILKKYFGDDPRTRSFMHALLLATHSADKRKTVLRGSASTASRSVVRKLSFMCQDGGTSLASRIKDIFQSAADLWGEIQYVDGDIKVVMSDIVHPSEWNWGFLEDFGDPSLQTEGLILFPGFYDDASKKELHHGIALWKDQEHVESANSEWRSFQRARKPKLGNGFSKIPHERRQSISLNGGFTPPLSPTSSPKDLQPRIHFGTRAK